MSDFWKRWEGQIVDGKYLLERCIASTKHSAVFLAETRDGERQRVAIKFLSADVPQPDRLLEAWKAAAELDHPGLLRIYASGRCRIQDMDLLYAAMEYAEENLDQILPRRALMAEETTQVLTTLTDVLVYLHGKNLTHGHVKPSNILAIGERLKISSDSIQPAGEVQEMRRERSAYDAPELPGAPYTPAADMWSLGVTLVEAITQQPAVLPFNENVEPVISGTVREPFFEIARQTLRRSPEARWSSEQIAQKLNPTVAPSAKAAAAVAAAGRAAKPVTAASTVAATLPVSMPQAPSLKAASASRSPLSVPLSQEPAVPLTKQAVAQAVRVSTAPPVTISEPREGKGGFVLPNYVVPVLGGLLVVAAFIVLPKILHRETQATANSASTSAAAPPNSTARSANSSVNPAATQPVTATKEAAKPVPPANVDAPASHPASANASLPAPALLRDSGATAAPKSSSAKLDRGEVLDQVLPQASAKALSTIHGTVRVGVKVHVDPSGNVSQAELEDPGPSKYFADKALTAAQQWEFSTPEANGRSAPSEWLIRFEYTPSGVKAFANQLRP